MENLYEILGVVETATQDEIKKAYRQKAKELHPDKGGDEEMFKKVTNAYDILSDENKKNQYDNERKYGGQFGGNFNFDDGFSDNFFSRFFRKPKTNIIRGEDLNLNLNLTLEEIYNGVTKTFRYKRKAQCQTCTGTGALNGNSFKICTGCSGSGQKIRTGQSFMGGFSQVITECDECNGLGKATDLPCSSCNGLGTEIIDDTVEIQSPKGIAGHMQFSVQGKGGFKKGATIPGNLLVTVTELPHDKFTRLHNDLHYDYFITIPEAILGIKDAIVPTVNGHAKINIEPGVESGRALRLAGKGMPLINDNRSGDLYIHINIYIPKELNEEELKLIEKLSKKPIFKIPENKKGQKGIFKMTNEI